MLQQLDAPPIEQRRDQPAEWPGLLERGTAILSAESPELQDAKLSDLLADISEMDQTTRDTNRYYAIGAFVCLFARELQTYAQDETKWQGLVDACVDNITAEHRHGLERTKAPLSKYATASPPRLSNANRILIPIFDKATADLPPEVELIGNTLEAAEGTNPTMRAILHGKPLTEQLCGNLFAGMISLEDATRRLQRFEHGGGPLSQERKAAIIAALNDPSALKLTRGMATIPIDLFNGPEIIAQQTDSKAVCLQPIDWKIENNRQARLIEEQAYDPANTRTTRLLCPALTVPTMFPTMQRLTVDILARTHV